MAFLSGATLISRVERERIVLPFETRLVDCNAYTLRMGGEYFLSSESGFKITKNKKKTLPLRQVFDYGKGEFVESGESFVIPPGQFAFLLTEEFVKIPYDLMGFISLRSSIKFKGLVNISGFHVDPGYQGNLVYSVFNAGPAQINISRREPLFKLWLTQLDDHASQKFSFSSKEGPKEIDNSLISPVARQVSSVQQLATRVKRLETQRTVIVSVFIVIATIASFMFTITKIVNN